MVCSPDIIYQSKSMRYVLCGWWMMTVALLVELCHQTHLPLPAFGRSKSKAREVWQPSFNAFLFCRSMFPVSFLYVGESALTSGEWKCQATDLICPRRRKLTEPTEAYHRQALRLQTSAFYVGLSSKLMMSS